VHRTFAALLALVLFAAPLGAQVRIDGIVRDDVSGAPLPRARVEVRDDFGNRVTTVTADTAGHFTVPLRRLGTYVLRTTSTGYVSADGRVRTEATPFVSVEMRLRTNGALLIPVAIVSRAQVLPPERLEGYHRRLRGGGAHFFPRETVDQLRPAYLAELIATAPGITVVRGGEDGEDRLLRGAGCAARVMVDGEPAESVAADGTASQLPLDGMVVAAQVEGIEV
jgi:hypothetical protein